MLESEVQQHVQLAAREFECNLMRNNCGAFKDEGGRVVFFGLGNISKKHSDSIKSSDLIGFTKVKITPEMVGQTVAVFTAIECKRSEWKGPKDKREIAQMAFINWVFLNGGYSGFANSVEALKKILRR